MSKELFLETLSAPADLGEHALRPADGELRTMSGNIKSFVIAVPAFGADDVGERLVSTYTSLQQDLADRLTKDATAITSAADALASISANYQALVQANTPAGR